MTEPEKTPRIVRVITPQDHHAAETVHSRTASPAELLAGKVRGGEAEHVEVVVEYCEGPTGHRQFTVDLGDGVPLLVPAEPPVEEWLLEHGIPAS
ncbi:hypothetical protein [Cryptosporangium japonicum]|uniref:Uncharacterized protein n=1 Tax=Cryptosporangium japonicum TaxID=80872 RepID=A0ABP3EU20_9ACTN